MATNTTADDPRGIFKLPAELRLQIYEHVIAAFDLTLVDLTETTINQSLLPLLNTCQLIRNEALPLYLKHVHTLDNEARAQQESAVDDIMEFLREARASGFNYDWEAFEKLQNKHEVLLNICIKLDQVLVREESIASFSDPVSSTAIKNT